MSSETVGDMAFLALVIILSGALGWVLCRMRYEGQAMDAEVAVSTQRSSEEVELFDVRDPSAHQPGSEWADFSVRPPRRFVITRLEDIGALTDINGKRYNHWRVYGRPA